VAEPEAQSSVQGARAEHQLRVAAEPSLLRAPLVRVAAQVAVRVRRRAVLQELEGPGQAVRREQALGQAVPIRIIRGTIRHRLATW
jgi:hypothetical protein